MGFDPMTIMAEIGISVGLHYLQKWLAEPPPPDGPITLSNLPGTAEGAPVPLVFGKCRVNKPILVWYSPPKRQDPDYLSDQTFGDFYGLNMLFVVGLPHVAPGQTSTGARLTGIWFNENKMDVNLVHFQYQPISAFGVNPTPFPRWGVTGLAQWFAGTSDQAISDNTALVAGDADITEVARFMRRSAHEAVTIGQIISQVDPTLIPGYRNQMLVALTGDHSFPINTHEIDDGSILDAFYFAASPALPNIAFEVSTIRDRYSRGPFPGGDADPVSVLYHIITSPWSGLNVDPLRINDASFAAASLTLFNEGHGYSNVIDSSRNGRSLIQEIVNQIAGVLYQDPADSQIHLALLRNDYNPTTIPSFDIRHVAKVERYVVGGWPDQINRVTVKFTDRQADYASSTAVALNQASAVFQDAATDLSNPGGKTRVVPVEYPGCSNHGLADALAARDLNLLSQPLSQLRIVFNRLIDLHATSNAAQLRPGSVFTLSLPSLKIFDVIFRVTKADLGQLGSNDVTVDAVSDVFKAGAVAFPGGGPIIYRPTPYPVRLRSFAEAPRWLQLRVSNLGLITGPDIQRVHALPRPWDLSPRFSEPTSKNPSAIFGGLPEQPDVPQATYPYSAKVATAYGRDKDPYDTTTGLVISTFWPDEATLTPALNTAWNAADIANDGRTLLLVGTEFMAFETATNLGGGQWRLNNVWRGLLDTAPHDHAIGEVIYFAGVLFGGQAYVGRRGWSDAATVRGRTIPQLGAINGSGEDVTDTITLRQRCLLPMRVAGMVLSGKSMLGTQGIPAVAGQFTAVSLLEEALDLAANRRDRLSTTVVRGELADSTQQESGVAYQLIGQKGSALEVSLGASLNNASALSAQAGSKGLLLGGVGYGNIDVRIRTVRTIQAGESGIFPSGTLITCWDPTTVRVVAPLWRNLLANSRFDYNSLTPGWTLAGGNATIGNDATSIPRDATGFYLKTTISGTGPTVTQTIDVAGYLARKMTARLIWYQRNLAGDSNDTCTVSLDPLDVNGTSLGSVATQTATAINASWIRTSINIAACPAGTTQLKLTAQINEVAAGGGTTLAEGALTEFELILGQHLYDVLNNPSFETGSTASWTNITNSFVVATAIQSPSQNYAQGGAFATSRIQQDYGLNIGYEVGSTVVLRAWRAQTIAGDTGKITLQCIDNIPNILATVDTTAENFSTLNQWVKRRLSLQVPAGTTAIRVILDAVRTGGAGNSGACFDELVLSVHKDLDPAYERALTFTAPSGQPLSASWQKWTLDQYVLFEAGLSEPVVFAGGNPSVHTSNASTVLMRWSDDVARAATKAFGQFGGGVTQIDSYKFTRQSGAGALDFQTTLEDGVRFMSPTTAQAFSAIMLFCVDEPGFATACGLMGRRDSVSGWDLAIDATGHLTFVTQGLSSTKTATRAGSTVHDGAWHLAAVVYDPVGNTITVYDERGSNATSTVGMGEMANVSEACQFRLGRGRPTIDTLPGNIGRVWCFPGVALSAGQVNAHWNYAKDPNATALAYTRNVVAWTHNTPNSAGDALACMATDQIALGYDTDLTTDGGTGVGLALASTSGGTNLVPSFDFAGASWVKDAAATLTQGLVDATGRARGVTVVSPNNTNGFKLIGATVGATTTVNHVFLARASAGTPTLRLELMNASDVVKNTQSVVLSTQWKRYVVNFTGWDASTGTCRIRFLTPAASLTFDLTHVMFVNQGTDVPPLLPLALGALNDVTATLAEAVPIEFNAEGEIVAVGVASVAAPNQASIANVKNGANNNNRRELAVGAVQVPRLDHYDSTVPTDVTSSGTAIDWSLIWTIRGRWCALQMLDVGANTFAGIVTTANVNSAVYGRAATFSYSAVAASQININSGLSGGLNGLLRSLTIRSREQKLV